MVWNAQLRPEGHFSPYKGWSLHSTEYWSEDGVWYFDEAVHDDGRRVVLQWSNHRCFTFEHFKMFVDLGLPGMMRRLHPDGREFFVPWWPADVEKAHSTLLIECAA